MVFRYSLVKKIIIPRHNRLISSSFYSTHLVSPYMFDMLLLRESYPLSLRATRTLICNHVFFLPTTGIYNSSPSYIHVLYT